MFFLVIMHMCLCMWCVHVHTCLCESAGLHKSQHMCGDQRISAGVVPCLPLSERQDLLFAAAHASYLSQECAEIH